MTGYTPGQLHPSASLVVGIDPGASGAIAVPNKDLALRDFLLMPTYKIGKSSRVNVQAVAEFLRRYQGADVSIEKVGAMPGQGVSSCFSFGHSAGSVEGIAAALCRSVTLVTPQKWKKAAGLIGKDKDAARVRACQLYPTEPMFHLKGKGQALADAVLIARFGG